jgi:tRNA (guanine26-N2/guanine27-N2)-dimethyltransferase
MTPATTTLIKEGTTEVFVHSNKRTHKGPSSRAHEPFYNPSMEENRDISILVNQWFINTNTKHVHLLDGLAASGIRGIRYARELTGDFDVTLNDWDDDSSSLIQRNIQHHSLQNVTVFQRDLSVLLSERRFDSIDIDPFGSPVYFFNAAVRGIYNHGIISCTATDTAALCGVFPKVCYRRYGAWPLHGPTMHEIGLRILLGVLCREAAKYDRGIEPLLCYSTDHYFRLYVQILNGKNAANTSMAQFFSIPAKDVPLSKEQSTMIGPLWGGKLQKKTVLKDIQTLVSAKELHRRSSLWSLLVLLDEEAEAPAFFYTTSDLSSLWKQSPPSMNRLFERLRQHGFLVTRTHFNPTGFKTNAPLDVIKEVFNS